MKQRFNFRSRGMKTAGICMMAAVLAGLLWAHSLNVNPTVHIPVQVMPKPNAFDDYVAAANSIRDGNKIAVVVSQRPGDTKAVGSNHFYSLGEKAALVAENEGALQRMRRGFAYPFRSPPIGSSAADFSYYAGFRGMARLLSLQARVKQAQGDWGGAANGINTGEAYDVC